jgi:hypothetical protein
LPDTPPAVARALHRPKLPPDSDALNGALLRAVEEAKSTAPPSVLAP